MPTKIRLQRHGRKAKAFYHIVIADGRAPRDGRFIEKLGTYNPLTKPADIDINFDRALYWLQTGAQPTDTVRAILSYKGVLYKSHLLKGVNKGALTLELAEEKFAAWLEEKQAKTNSKIKEQALLQKEEHKQAKEAESKVNEARAAELAKKYAKEAEKQAAKAHKQPESAAAQAQTPVAPSLEEPEVALVKEETIAKAEVSEVNAEAGKAEATKTPEEEKAV